jgi:hypothetical protein
LFQVSQMNNQICFTEFIWIWDKHEVFQ